MPATVQVEHIQFNEVPDQDGVEGGAYYLILIPCAEDRHPCSGT